MEHFPSALSDELCTSYIRLMFPLLFPVSAMTQKRSRVEVFVMKTFELCFIFLVPVNLFDEHPYTMPEIVEEP